MHWWVSIFHTRYENVTVNFLPDMRIQNLFPLTFKVIDGFNLPGWISRANNTTDSLNILLRIGGTIQMNLCELSMTLKILTIIFAFQSYGLLLVIIVDNLYCKVTYNMVLSCLIFFSSFICCNVIREFIWCS